MSQVQPTFSSFASFLHPLSEVSPGRVSPGLLTTQSPPLSLPVQTKVEVIKVEDGKETQGHTTFRRELLIKCQREFEKDKKDDEEREKMLTAIDEAETVS